MQGGNMQFKVDQPGLMKSGLIPVIVGAVGGLLWISLSLWTVAGLIGWLAPLFAGVWYVMTKRKDGAMPEQMDALVNGAILGAVVGLVYSIIALITAPMGLSSAFGGLGLGGLGFGAFGFGELIARVIGGAIAGAVGAFGYMMLVKQGSIK
ncbi:MAG TPA: hypothetical protein VFK30_12420 [Anaerolineae bacterium]|nr:hypothetical protein [Anaerolineae bacterium]